MQNDLSWLGELSEETLAAIQADLGRLQNKSKQLETELSEQTEPKHYVRLVTGELKPGRYRVTNTGKTRSQVQPGEEMSETELDQYVGAWGGAGKRWVPLWDARNECVTQVPEKEKDFYLGQLRNSPPLGTYIDIIPGEVVK